MQIIEQLCRVLILILLEVTQINHDFSGQTDGESVLILILLEVTQILQILTDIRINES